MRKIYCIMNPGSNGGKSAGTFERIIGNFQRNNIECVSAVTRYLDEAQHLSACACHEGYDTIVAVGGDGTINRVLNGFYSSEGKLFSDTRLGVIHTGTSPDFCRSYGIPKHIDEACDTIVSGSVRSIPAGMVRFENRTFGERTAFFGCCANIGLGAQLAAMANSGIRTVVGDFAGTLLSLLFILIRYHPISLSVTVDGVQRTMDKVYNMSIGKTELIASGIRVKNNLTDDDERLYGLTVHHLGFASIPRCLSTLYRGNAITNSDIFQFEYGRSYYLHAFGKKVDVEFDGDPAGYLPCTITTAPQRLPLFCRV